MKDFKVCSRITRDDQCSNPIINNGVVDENADTDDCTYSDESELRYVLVY